jgi:hypothetical protein
MFNTRIARNVFFILIIVSIFLPLYLYQRLPYRIAYHFNIDNIADDWMSKRTYLVAHFGIIISLTVIFTGAALLMHKMPSSLFNLPNKAFWLTEQNKTNTTLVLQGMLYWIGSLCLLLFLYVFYQVYKANIMGTGRIDSFSWFAIIIFLMADGIIILKYISYFNNKENNRAQNDF